MVGLSVGEHKLRSKDACASWCHQAGIQRRRRGERRACASIALTARRNSPSPRP